MNNDPNNGGAPSLDASTAQPQTKPEIIAYPEHRFAGIFPMMTENDDYELFKADLQQFGQKDPVVIFEGAVLDGRNRQKALIEVNILPIYREFDPATEGEPLDFVMAHNLHRRHLSAGQRAAIALDFESIFAEEAKLRRTRGQGSAPAADSTQGYDKEEDAGTGATAEQGDAGGAEASGGSSVDTSGDFNQDQGTKGDAGGAGGTNGAKPGGKKSSEATRSRTKAAKTLGVSARAVGDAKKLKATDPAAFEEVKKGKRTLNAAMTGAPSKGSTAAEEYEKALARITTICGDKLAKAIREGARLKSRKDVIAYAALDDQKMVDIRHMIEHGWTLNKATHYKAETILPTHRIIDAINRAAADGNASFKQIVLTPEIGCDWELTLKPVKRAPLDLSKFKVGDVIPGDPEPAPKKRVGRPKKVTTAAPAAAPAQDTKAPDAPEAKKAPAKKKVARRKPAAAKSPTKAKAAPKAKG
jgi:hypothetical protein